MKKLDSITDKELVLQFQSGNKQIISLLVKRWHVQFCKLAYWYVKDTDIAKDIAQESWQTILYKLPTLENPERFKSWSISIVNRKAIDWLRANKRVEGKYQKYYKENKRNILEEEQDEQQKLKNKLLKAIQKLSIEQQVVIKLFYTESYSLKEISKLLNISIGTAKSRLFHAREKLKTILKK
ncbi:RNA polymerase sigma factor [Tenacibaculum sp. S7007]|uniref:RNA polymerase sigma factor n=1 Tax=Tenacibaculum pelagium TaxID=2759527 RepID=A0A839AJG2_9FLAO|nr:RNA polymerase sigma factor [Tenacibaculum pelagium]MBA6155195.1 RNA polymerase sigma factor [Tenacibaculum pelagium]